MSQQKKVQTRLQVEKAGDGLHPTPKVTSLGAKKAKEKGPGVPRVKSDWCFDFKLQESRPGHRICWELSQGISARGKVDIFY